MVLLSRLSLVQFSYGHTRFSSRNEVQKIIRIHNIRSDVDHIGMGAYCSAILSGDRGLVERAKAIYQYKNIGTSPVLIEKTVNKSNQQR